MSSVLKLSATCAVVTYHIIISRSLVDHLENLRLGQCFQLLLKKKEEKLLNSLVHETGELGQNIGLVQGNGCTRVGG